MATPRKKVSSKTYKPVRVSQSGKGPAKKAKAKTGRGMYLDEGGYAKNWRGTEGPKRSMPRKKK